MNKIKNGKIYTYSDKSLWRVSGNFSEGYCYIRKIENNILTKTWRVLSYTELLLNYVEICE